MITNLEKPITLPRGQQVATASRKPLATVNSNIIRAQIFEVETNEKRKYKKRNLNARSTALNSQYPADFRVSQKNQNYNSISADVIDLRKVQEELHPHIRKIFKCQKPISNDHFGSIKVEAHAIDLREDAKPFKLAPYRSEPTAHQLESSKFKTKLDTDFIKPAISAWATQSILFSRRTAEYAFGPI